MSTGQRDFRIQQVVQVLTQNPSRTLPQLANVCQISTSRLSHLFKDETGISVKDYRLICRLEIAGVALASTSTPIKEIAYKAGYRHTSSFVRAFKTHFGVPPTQYRASKRQQHPLTNSKNS
jgi:AraC family transcriptional regulator, arabinose operon regulatory protein